MEGPDIEASAKPLLCAVAKIENLELTYLIAEALSRPCNIPIDFGFDRRLICGAAFAEVGHCLFPSPTLGVNARVNHQTDRAHQLQREPSIIRRRILEKADLLTERLRINRPALGIGVVDDVKSKLRQASKPLLDGNLHVMARDTLVVGLRLVAEQFSMGIVGSSNDDASWPRSIRGAKNIVSGIVRLGGGHSFHSQRGFREHSEEFRKAWLHLANVATEILHDLIRRFRYVFRITI